MSEQSIRCSNFSIVGAVVAIFCCYFAHSLVILWYILHGSESSKGKGHCDWPMRVCLPGKLWAFSPSKYALIPMLYSSLPLHKSTHQFSCFAISKTHTRKQCHNAFFSYKDVTQWKKEAQTDPGSLPHYLVIFSVSSSRARQHNSIETGEQVYEIKV